MVEFSVLSSGFSKKKSKISCKWRWQSRSGHVLWNNAIQFKVNAVKFICVLFPGPSTNHLGQGLATSFCRQLFPSTFAWIWAPCTRFETLIKYDVISWLNFISSVFTPLMRTWIMWWFPTRQDPIAFTVCTLPACSYCLSLNRNQSLIGHLASITHRSSHLRKEMKKKWILINCIMSDQISANDKFVFSFPFVSEFQAFYESRKKSQSFLFERCAVKFTQPSWNRG